MTYYDEDLEEIEREPRTLLDFYIEPEARCVVCGVQNSTERPMNWVCSECGGATHTECGQDTEPSGGWDRDYDVNYWVCNNCLKQGTITMQEVAATVIEDLRRESLEAQRLERAEHDHDFSALVATIIEDLETLAAKYKGLLQALYGAPEELAPFDHEQAIAAYTALMEAGPLAENEQVLRTLIEQAHAQGLYFDYDREAQRYRLVSPEQEARTDTIENIATSVDDKDIDAWLARQAESEGE